MAIYSYAIYDFDGKRIAKRLPRAYGLEDILKERNYEYVSNIYDELEYLEEIDFVELRTKKVTDHTLADMHAIDRCVKFTENMVILSDSLEDLLFYLRYHDNLVDVVSEADDRFDESLADVWLD